MQQYNIIIADDHQMFIDGVRLILKQQKNLSVAAQALNGDELMQLLLAKPCDLVITDLNMPGLSGIELIRTLKKNYPGIKLLVISMHNDHELVHEVLMAEAEGYILKNSGKKELLEAINAIMDGKTHYEKAVLDMMLRNVRVKEKARTAAKPLSAREQEIVQLIVQELTSREIGDRLFISKQTVDKHRLNIMEKTGAATLVGLIKYAIQEGLAS